MSKKGDGRTPKTRSGVGARAKTRKTQQKGKKCNQGKPNRHHRSSRRAA